MAAIYELYLQLSPVRRWITLSYYTKGPQLFFKAGEIVHTLPQGSPYMEVLPSKLYYTVSFAEKLILYVMFYFVYATDWFHTIFPCPLRR